MWSDRQLGQGDVVRRAGELGDVKPAKSHGTLGEAQAWHGATQRFIHARPFGPLRRRVHALRETNKEKKVWGGGVDRNFWR